MSPLGFATAVLCFLDGISYPLWQKLADAVRTGHGQAQFGKFDPAQQEIFWRSKHSPDRSRQRSRQRTISAAIGGCSTWEEARARSFSPSYGAYPALRGTLFELPGACTVARQRLSAEPEGTRIDIVEGDVFQTPLPIDHDVLLIANTIHVFSAVHN
jgi:O-methyltransferase domain